MSSLYTDEVRRVFKSIRPPLPGFIVDMTEYELRGYLALRVYRDNIESFSDGQKVMLAGYLYQLRDAIRDLGVQCHIEGKEKSPPNFRGDKR
jgi:hypothetical protein